MQEQMMVIYHGTCADGFMAALPFWIAAPESEFVPAVYGNDLKLPDNVDGRQVMMVDFCYPREMMEELADRAKQVIVLDHHKSAKENMEGFQRDNVSLVFDMEQSGAGLAWRWMIQVCHLELGEVHDIPDLVKRVEDRDLWRFQYPDTKDVQAALFSYPYEFPLWEELLTRPIEELAAEGQAIQRKHMKDVNEWINGGCVRRMTIAGHNVPVLNVPYQFGSEAGNILAQGEPFAAIYFDVADGRRWSLRSADDGLDVSAIAKSLGGGGHFHASGFSTAHDWFGD